MDDQPGDHYFAERPASDSAPRAVALVLPDLSLHLTADRGVFSSSRVDPGTKFLLLDGPHPPEGATDLVDVGCGYGPIALSLARRAPDATIWAVDVNARARELCALNAESNGLGNVRVIAPADVPDDLVVDALYSNPPIRIGKPRLRELLLGWLQRLTPEGRAHLVVGKNLGSDSLQRWLVDQGWPTRRRAARSGYRLLDVERPPR